MRLLNTTFYYIIILLSVVCGILIIAHDVVANILTDVDLDTLILQAKLRVAFWIVFIIQQIMFCYWLMAHYNALSSLHITKRFSGLMAWTEFIPLLNLYFPQSMVSELEDRLYYLHVKRINVRFVPVWWFFQSIAFIYLDSSCFFSFWKELPWLTIVMELIWGVAIFCQGYMLFGFMEAVQSKSKGIHERHRPAVRRH